MEYELDHELAAVAKQLPKREKDALADVFAMREVARKFAAYAPTYEAEHPLDVFDVTIPGSEGGPGPDIRVYAPTDQRGPLPGLMFIHAGGYVMGDLEFGDSSARFLADKAGTVVVSVDYRLALEHPYPPASKTATRPCNGWRAKADSVTASTAIAWAFWARAPKPAWRLLWR